MGEQSPRAMVGTRPEDVLVFVSWGSLSSWTLALIEAAAAKSTPPVECRWVGPNDELGDFGRGQSRRPRIVMTQAPGPQANAVISEVKCVVVIEDPSAATMRCSQTTGSSRMEALRAVSHAFAINLAMRQHKKRLALFHHDSFNARAQAEAVLAHCGLFPDLAARDELFEVFCGPPSYSLSQAVMRQQASAISQLKPENSRPDDPSQDVIAKAMNAIARMGAGLAIEPIIWDRRLFYDGTAMDKPLPDRIDLTGPPRQLAGGPLLHVPAARYKFQLYISLDWRDPLPFRLEICWLGSSVAPPVEVRLIDKLKTGRYRIEAELELMRPQDILDIRLTSLEAAIEGTLVLEYAELVPLQ